MARRKDIAGLAALGALGMMLSGDSKGKSQPEGKTPEASPSMDLGKASDYGDFAEIASRNENYGNEGTRTGSNGTVPIDRKRRPSRPSSASSSARSKSTSSRSDSSRASVGTGSAGQKGPGFGEEAAYRQQQYEAAQAQANTPQGRAERQSKAESQALGQIRPEEYVIGAPMSSVKAVANMARGLANRRGAEKMAEYSQPAIGYAERKLLEGGGSRALLEGPPKRLTGPSAQTASRSGEVAESGREAVTNPMAWAGGPKSMRDIQAAEDAARVRKGMFEMDTTGGAIGYKRGGMVKKSAKAMPSKPVKMSASSRGDGIAMRGKTRGMMR
jgi:hypothetical protein